jgi:hypothetical protein
MIGISTCYAPNENECKLTSSFLATKLYPVAHIGGTGLASRIRRRINAAICGIFMRIALSYRYDGVSEAAERRASPSTGTPTLLILSPMIGVFGGRFSICFEGSQS